jgi:hypothetical protein
MLDQQQDAATAVVPTVALRDVHKVYGEGEVAVRALDGVDLEIGAAELVVRFLTSSARSNVRAAGRWSLLGAIWEPWMRRAAPRFADEAWGSCFSPST